jgi:hypothetical protein
VIDYKYPEAMQAHICLHDVQLGAKGNYSHVRDIKLQLANGAGLADRFLIVSDLSKSKYSEVFPETGSCQRSPHQHRLVHIGVHILLCWPSGGLMPILEEGLFHNG